VDAIDDHFELTLRAQPQRGTSAGPLAFRPLRRGEVPTGTGIGAFGRDAVGGVPRLVDLPAGAVAGIREAGLLESIDGIDVSPATVTLMHDGAVPVEPQEREVADLAIGDARALGIGDQIVDPQPGHRPR
jgi:hypothetical protein